RLDLVRTDEVHLNDEWRDLAVDLSWSEPAGLWCYPIETVSQSEGGFEGVYQSSAVVPHWTVRADESRRWEVALSWSVGQVRTSGRLPRRAARNRAHVRGVTRV